MSGSWVVSILKSLAEWQMSARMKSAFQRKS